MPKKLTKNLVTILSLLTFVLSTNGFLAKIPIANAKTSQKLQTTTDKNNPAYYLERGYKPKLAPSYKFPLKLQTLNACYFFAVKNIISFKNKKSLNIKELEQKIKKDRTKISTTTDVNNFNKAAEIKAEKLRTLESFFKNVKQGEPLIVTYMKQTTLKNGTKTEVPHIVAAYSFDEKGIWVAETISGKRIRIPYSSVFEKGKSKYNPLWKVSLK